MVSELPLANCCVLWAQRADRLFLALEIDDLSIEKLECEGNHLHLRGANKANRFEINLDLFAAVKFDEHEQIETGRHLQLIIPKADDAWWPRLLEKKEKVQWVKVDFEKWIDEDEANEEAADALNNPFASYMDGGMPSNFQFPGATSLGDLGEDDDEDQADGELTEEGKAETSA